MYTQYGAGLGIINRHIRDPVRKAALYNLFSYLASPQTSMLVGSSRHPA